MHSCSTDGLINVCKVNISGQFEWRSFYARLKQIGSAVPAECLRHAHCEAEVREDPPFAVPVRAWRLTNDDV